MLPAFHSGRSSFLDPDSSESEQGQVCAVGNLPAKPPFPSLAQRLTSWGSQALAGAAAFLSGIGRSSRGTAPNCYFPPARESFAHIEDIQLLGYLDGELSREMRHQVVHHLQACWSCRARLRNLSSHIEAFLSERENRMPRATSEAGQRVWELRQRLSSRLAEPPFDIAR